MNSLQRMVFYILLFAAIFNLTSTMSAANYIVSDLGGSSVLSPYSVSFFALGFAGTFGLGHHLSARFGKRKVIYVALIAFTIANFLCSLFFTYFTFLLFRFLYGCAGGVLSQASRAILMENSSKEEESKTRAYTALITTLTTSLGIAFGAFIAYEYLWPWIFHLQLPILIASIVVIHFYKPVFIRTNFDPFDWIGYLAYLFTISSLVTVTSMGQQLDWFRSPLINNLIGAFGIFSVFFILWELKAKIHFIKLRLCKSFLFIMSLIYIFIINTTYYGVTTLLSLWLHIEVNYTPIYIAVVVLTMIISALAFFFALRKFEKIVTSFESIMAAILIYAIGAFYSTTFNSEINLARLLISHTIIGFGFSFSTLPIILYAIRSLSEENIDHGMSILLSFRALSISLGPVFYSTMWIKRTVFYNVRLGSYLTSYSELTTQTLNQTLFYTNSKEQVKELLDKALNRQATALAIADCFYFMGWLMIAILALGIVYLFVRRRTKKRSLGLLETQFPHE